MSDKPDLIAEFLKKGSSVSANSNLQKDNKMNVDVLNDFAFYSSVSNEIIEKYKEVVPSELLDVWKNYGLGMFYSGYLKIINPDEYRNILNDSYYAGDDSIPIFTTGFGDIIIWRKKKYIGLIKYRKHTTDTLCSGFKFFFNDLIAEQQFVNKLDKNLYDDAVSKYGSLEYDECFGYVPLLPLGGSESVENIQKVKIKPHIDLITQLVGRIV